MQAIVYLHMQLRDSQTYLLGLSQNQMPRGSTLVNLATDRTRKQSQPGGTSAKAMLFARWRHYIHFASGSLMPPLTQW